mgnify:CR=1 FL=1
MKKDQDKIYFIINTDADTHSSVYLENLRGSDGKWGNIS